MSQLLEQQVPESHPPAHDELLFIVVHQVYELWFKLLLHELEEVRDAILVGRYWWARHLLTRVHTIEGVLVKQLSVLETMTPQDFLEFRSKLEPASGFQSAQFREMEFISGAKDPGYLNRFRGLTESERTRLIRRIDEPSLWDAYLTALDKAGLAIGDDAQIMQSLLTIARDRDTHGELWELGEALLTHDEMAGMWRARHVQMVERQIGTKSGTGGSTGAPYLRSRVPLHYYPLLWEMRTWL